MEINGIQVLDATKPMKITITDRDITRGDTKDPAACAAALACKRDLNATEARVHIGRTYVKINNKWTRFNTPKSMRGEIIAFDRGGTFMPGEYTLLPPHHSNKRTVPRAKKPKPRIAKIKRYHTVAGIRDHGANR